MLPQGCFEDDTQHGTWQVVSFSARCSHLTHGKVGSMLEEGQIVEQRARGNAWE